MWLILIFGVMGYLMRKLNYPVAPAVLAIVLGPLAERSFRQTVIGSHGDLMIFVERPMSATFLVLAVLLTALPLVKLWRLRRAKAMEAKA